MDNYEYGLDLRDLIAQLLYKAKWILIFMLIGIIVAIGFWKYASVQAANVKVTDEDIDVAKKVLSTEQISQVDYLYAQYISYIEYRKSLQKYLSDSLYSSDDYDGNIGMNVLYFIDSDINDVNQIVCRLALRDDIYDEIAKVLGRSRQMMDDVYRRVSIGDISAQSPDIVNINVKLDNVESSKGKKNALQVYIIAENKEQADQIAAIIDQSLRMNAKRLKEVDEGLSLTQIGYSYTSDIASYVDSRQDLAISKLNSVNDQINNHQTSYIDKLTSDEKAYYELLKKRDELNADHPVILPSLKKDLVIGAFIGAILSACWFILRYIFDDTVKTAADMKRNSCEEPVVIYQNMPNAPLFSKFARRLINADPLGETVQAQMTAADIAIMLQKKAVSSVYLICDDNTDNKHLLIEQLRVAMSEKNGDVVFYSGDPLRDISELERLSQAEVAVMLVQLKKDERRMVRKWKQMCSRYVIPVVRAIAVEEC